MIEQRRNPLPEIGGYAVGNPDRLVELPNPVPAQRIPLDSVDEYLAARGLDPTDFLAFLDAPDGAR